MTTLKTVFVVLIVLDIFPKILQTDGILGRDSDSHTTLKVTGSQTGEINMRETLSSGHKTHLSVPVGSSNIYLYILCEGWQMARVPLDQGWRPLATDTHQHTNRHIHIHLALCLTRSPSINPDSLWMTANNYVRQHVHTHLSDLITLQSSKPYKREHTYAHTCIHCLSLSHTGQTAGWSYGAHAAPGEHGRQPGWKHCTPLGRKPPEIPPAPDQVNMSKELQSGWRWRDHLSLGANSVYFTRCSFSPAPENYRVRSAVWQTEALTSKWNATIQ